MRALLALFLLSLPLPAAEPAPRIDPAGIKGALVLCGAGDPSAEAVEQFLSLAGGKTARAVVFHSGTVPARLASLSAIRTGSPDVLEKLKQATGVWVVDGDRVKEPKVTAQCLALLARNGVLASKGDLFALLSGVTVITPAPGVKNTPLGEVLKKAPGQVGCELAPGSALVVKGRTLTTLGTGKVTLHLAASKKREARTIELDVRQRSTDLTMLRQAASARTNPDFPSAKPGTPVVEKGTLVIIGGGGMPQGMVPRFVELAGGKNARIVILPTAMPDPLPERDGIGEAFKRAGAAKVTMLKGRTLAEVENADFLGALKEATGVWFGGGRQWRLVDAYAGTKAEEAIRGVLQRGGVIGGSSAGATIQGEYLCRGSPLNNFEMACEGYERGLCLLPGSAIDQHFAQRMRFADMTSLMKLYPQFLGIGIDEATAIVVRGRVAEVTGRGSVHFYDAGRKPEKDRPDHDAVKSGGRYDLVERKILAP